MLFEHKRKERYRTGLAYVQEALNRNSPAAIALVVSKVPLAILMQHGFRGVLLEAAARGEPGARTKLGAWMTFRSSEREEGWRWLQAAHPDWAAWQGTGPRDEGLVVELISLFACDDIEGYYRAAKFGAQQAVKFEHIGDAMFCCMVAAGLGPLDAELARLILWIIEKSAFGISELPVDLLASSLRLLAEENDPVACRILGRAYAGLRAESSSLERLNLPKSIPLAWAFLLKAGESGNAGAWLDVHQLALRWPRGGIGSALSRHFLHRAAETGIARAQTRLGAMLMTEATTLKEAEAACVWLFRAAANNERHAISLLKTMVLPLPPLTIEADHRLFALARRGGDDMEIRLRLARVFHLTRREAIALDGAAHWRAWGLVMEGTSKENPKGRMAPAVTAEMQSELASARLLGMHGVETTEAAVRRRNRLLNRLLEICGLNETDVFAQAIGRSLSHYGFGRHWAVKAAHILAEILDSGYGTAVGLGQEIEPG